MRLLIAGVFGMTLALVTACGYDSPIATVIVDEPIDTSGTAPASRAFILRQFTPFFSGTIDFTLAWTNPSVNLDLYVTDGQCVALPVNPLAGGCTIKGYSTNTAGNSERTTLNTVAATVFRFWVVNPSTTPEPVTSQLILRF